MTLPKVLPQVILSAGNQAFRWVLRCRFKALILAVPVFFVLCLMRDGYLEDPPGFIPVPRLLLAYFLPGYCIAMWNFSNA